MRCRLTETGSVAQLCTYARINTVEVPFTGDFMDAWEDPSSFFLLSSKHQQLTNLFLRVLCC